MVGAASSTPSARDTVNTAAAWARLAVARSATDTTNCDAADSPVSTGTPFAPTVGAGTDEDTVTGSPPTFAAARRAPDDSSGRATLDVAAVGNVTAGACHDGMSGGAIRDVAAAETGTDLSEDLALALEEEPAASAACDGRAAISGATTSTAKPTANRRRRPLPRRTIHGTTDGSTSSATATPV